MAMYAQSSRHLLTTACRWGGGLPGAGAGGAGRRGLGWEMGDGTGAAASHAGRSRME